jgi:hypothetical protein
VGAGAKAELRPRPVAVELRHQLEPAASPRVQLGGELRHPVLELLALLAPERRGPRCLAFPAILGRRLLRLRISCLNCKHTRIVRGLPDGASVRSIRRMLRRGGVLTGLALFLLPAALTATALGYGPLVDIYIRASVVERVPRKNAARVTVNWDFQCFGDRLGSATYRWTLKVVRLQPKPERTVTLLSGTSKAGAARVQLSPGRYEPRADPFRCETFRGAVSAEPEIGAPFVVPDYCSWTVAETRGKVAVERFPAVKAVRRADVIRPGDVVSTGRRSSLQMRSREGGTVVELASASRAKLDRRHCVRRGGWKFVLAAGRMRSRLAERDRRGPYEVTTSNARVTASRAAWTVEAGRRRGKPWTRVTVQTGHVTVRGGRGAGARLAAGMKTTIAGAAAAPSRSRSRGSRE